MFAKSNIQIDFTKDLRFKKIKDYFNFTDTAEYAKDFGCIISEKPLAIFTPPTIEILQQFLGIVNEYQIKITCRGKGNAAYGQSQVKDGVIIDLKNMEMTLNFNSDDHSSISIPAFKTWLDVTEFSKSHNKTVPVTVDNLDLTVGGTLSFGALGGTSYRCGSGADNVLSLGVMTLDGKYHTCSKTENRELFDAVLCGIGQFGIIINVNAPLITAKKYANMHLLSYDNATKFLQEQKALYESEVFDHLKGFIRKNEKKWEYVIEAVSYYDDQENQCVANELEKLSPNQHTKQVMSYWDFINMVTGFVKLLRESGKLNTPHPWYNILMPDNAIETHLAKVLDTPHFTGTEPIIIYPMHSNHFQQPLFMKPDSTTFYLLGALYNTSFDAENNFPYKEILERNKILYADAKENGGCRYPVDAISFTPEDWSNHYGEKWGNVCSLKDKYDHNHLLTSGVDMFSSNLKNEHRFVF